MAQFTADFEGLGLPSNLYWDFATLLSYATQGESYCATLVGGFCILPQSCESYPDLWEYSFQL